MRSRREFIRRCCELTAATAAMPLLKYAPFAAHAQGSDYKALVCVFLFGGNDGFNMIVPTAAAGDRSYSAYAATRRGIALTQAQLLQVQGAGGLGYGLHPNLTNLKALYDRKLAAAILNVGTLVTPTTKTDMQAGRVQVPRNLYSHSDQVAEWQNANPFSSAGPGWGGRVMDILAANHTGLVPPSISVNGNSLLLTGTTTRPMTLSPGSRFGLDEFGSTAGKASRQTALTNLLTLDSGVSLIGAANGIFGNAVKGAQEVNAALGSAPPLATVFPNSGLGNQLRQVATVMQVRAQLGMTRHFFFAGMGGFDNHSDLLTSHAGLMQTVDAAVGAFTRALEEIGILANVTLFTESEFGRTMGPSATAGSDHAWGSNHFAVGGAVQGGTTYGNMPIMQLRGPDDAGDRGLWIPTIALDQYAASMAKWFGLSDASILQVFPNLANFPAKTLGFV